MGWTAQGVVIKTAPKDLQASILSERRFVRSMRVACNVNGTYGPRQSGV